MTFLGPAEKRVLVDLSTRAGDAALLVGAVAMGVRLPRCARGTRDIDALVRLDFEETAEMAAALGWSPTAVERRWSAPEGVSVDLVPASTKMMKEGFLTWPRSGRVMSLAGAEFAFQESSRVPLGPDGDVRVPAVHALVMLKMIAYRDRPFLRDDDLVDIARLLLHGASDEERWQLDIDYELASAHSIGALLGSKAGDRDAALVRSFVATAFDQSGLHVLDVMERVVPGSEGEPEMARLLLTTFSEAFEGARP